MDHKSKSALNVMGGVEQPGQINPELVTHLRSKRARSLTIQDYVNGIIGGDRTVLSKAITLVESSLTKDQEIANQIINRCIEYQASISGNPNPNSSRHHHSYPPHSTPTQPHSHIKEPAPGIRHPASIRIGITGVPGVGKSTFIEALGTHLTSRGHKLAVLAIDPSSTRSKGSILGDKTRMETLATDPNAFIRPSPSAGSLGGVARKTRETIILCETAGFDVIFVETVGVGQSEIAVHSMVDFFLLLMLAGAGDELQGIKRGIIEMADAIMIHKADGDNLPKASAARVEYTNALHLFPPPESGWKPVVDICSSRTKLGIDRVREIIREYRELTLNNGYFLRHRMEQNRQILFDTIETGLQRHFFSRKEIAAELRTIEQDIMNGSINPYTTAKELLQNYFEKK